MECGTEVRWPDFREKAADKGHRHWYSARKLIMNMMWDSLWLETSYTHFQLADSPFASVPGLTMSRIVSFYVLSSMLRDSKVKEFYIQKEKTWKVS